jgi:signal transduction histidine kinase
VERNAVRLRGMIEDLLVLNKIEASGVQPSLATVPVAGLVASAVEVLRPQAALAEVSLQTAPVDSALMVSVEPRHLERALLNLGSNALKFTPAGGRVEITAVGDGDDVVITVADTGIGIPAADLDQLFGRFFRASNATAAAIPGTGLGLAIVRQIIEGHDGELTLESTEGEGTTVRVRLPLASTSRGNAPVVGSV